MLPSVGRVGAKSRNGVTKMCWPGWGGNVAKWSEQKSVETSTMGMHDAGLEAGLSKGYA